MKKQILYILSSLLLFVGCTTTTEGFEREEALVVSLNNVEAECDAESVTIKVNSLVPYEVKSTEAWSWITPSKKSGARGNSEFKLVISENKTINKRKAAIIVQNIIYGLSHDIVVTQNGAKPAISISKGSIDSSAESHKGTIIVTSNIPWTASCSADWVTLSQTTGEKGETALTVTVKENATTSDRSATVKIFNSEYDITKEIKISQGKLVPELNVDVTEISTTTFGETKSVMVTSNIPWTASCSSDWVTLSQTKGEKGKTALDITIKENAIAEQRTAIVQITNSEYSKTATINVEQGGYYAIIYTSSNGTVVTPYESDVFGANIVSNTYRDGQGVIIFDAPVASIGNSAFYNCDSLTSVTIPDSVTVIGMDAFGNCDWLKAFYGKFASADNRCLIIDGVLHSFAPAGLTEYTIPDSVTSIGDSAFSRCSRLTSVTIGNSVTSIGNYAFFWCSSLTSITIPDSVTSIGIWAFENCDSLTSVTIGNSVTLIGDYAFYGCGSLTSVTIPDSVTSIGTKAFYYCDSLTNITIPDSVTSIGDAAFLYCTSLTSITIPDSVTLIGTSAFCSCSSLKAFKGKFASADNRCLVVDGVLNSFAPAGLTEYTIPDSVTSIGEDAFWSCTSLTSVTIPNSVTSIGNYAFQHCSSLTSVTIPNSVTSIGEEAFRNCSSLTSVTIPDSVTLIEYRAFYTCTSLTSVTIGNGVASIGQDAFRNCSSLTSVTIPDSVTSIGRAAFDVCSSLTSVYCKPTTPPAGGKYMFDKSASGRKIYVPRNSIEAYKLADGWSDYADHIVGYDF